MDFSLSKLIDRLSRDREDSTQDRQRPLGRRPLSEEAVRKMQQHLLALQNAASRSEEIQIDLAESFVQVRIPSAILSGLNESPRECAIRIQRTLAGVSRSLRRTMPIAARKSSTGELHVHWTSSDDGSVQAKTQWEGMTETSNLAKELLRALRVFGEFGGDFSQVLTPIVLRALHDATVSLPEFMVSKPENGRASWSWRRQELESQEIDEATAARELDRLLQAAQMELEAAGIT